MSKVIDFIKRIPKFVFKYKFTILCLVYFCIVTVCATYSSLEGYISRPSIVHALSFFFVLNILSKVKYPAIPTVILSILIAFDAYFAFVYSSSMSTGIMGSIFETNKVEATEALKKAALIGTLVFTVTTALIFLAKKELKPVKLSVTKSFIILFAYLILFIPGMIYRKLSVNEVWAGSFRLHPLNTAQSLTSQHFPLITSNFLAFVTYQNEMHRLKKYLSTERKLPEGIYLDKTKDSADKIFFVIGESSWREHYSLYGYPIRTTPFLDSLSQVVPSPMRFYNAVAPATFTRDATRILMSFSTTRDINPFFEEKNILDLANEAGYETIWISSQGAQEMDGSYLGYISTFAKQSFFDTNTPRYDTDLLPVIERFYKSGSKQFFIIHSNGSHLSYNQRVQKTDEEAIKGDNKNNTVQYDRTIYHTDRFLKGISSIMSKDSASVMYYVPDHSEIIGVGHGFVKGGSVQFDIPLITINKSHVPVDSIVERYIDPKTSLINSSNSIYILSEFMGYNVSAENVNKAIADGKYILHADGKIYLYEDTKTIK